MGTVKIVYQSSGKALKGQKVSIGFNNIGRRVTSSEYTGGDGEAHFDTKPGDGKVFVNGSTKHKGHLSGRIEVYI